MKKMYYVGLELTSDEQNLFNEKFKGELIGKPMKWFCFGEDGFLVDTDCHPVLVEWEEVEDFLTIHTIREIKSWKNDITEAFFTMLEKL